MFVSVITGTRPQIIKSAPIMTALEESSIPFDFIHTGQHYDYEMAGAFIEEFSLPAPINLNVGSLTPLMQLTAIMNSLHSHLLKNRPDFVIIPGDTTSAFAAALVSFKLEIPICHVESGLRRYDYSYQEEIHRRLIDHGSSALFTPTDTATKNLEIEQVLGKVYQIGDPNYDILKRKLPYIRNSENIAKIREQFEVPDRNLILMTLHRRENVDDYKNLVSIIEAINTLDAHVILPIHPRTEKKLVEFSIQIDESHIDVINPISHDEFLSLLSISQLAISDSGGVQKESYIMNIPLVSLHDRCEWIETIEAGSTRLTRITTDAIKQACNEMLGKKLNNDPSVYGDGDSAKKIPPILESGEITIPKDRRENPFASRFFDMLN